MRYDCIGYLVAPALIIFQTKLYMVMLYGVELLVLVCTYYVSTDGKFFLTIILILPLGLYLNSCSAVHLQAEYMCMSA